MSEEFNGMSVADCWKEIKRLRGEKDRLMWEVDVLRRECSEAVQENERLRSDSRRTFHAGM